MSVSNEHGVTALVAHHIDGQLCPYCGQGITAAQFRKIQALVANQAAEFEHTKAEISRAIFAERELHQSEKLRLESRLADMQRQLQAKPAHQRGEPAEADLYDTLRVSFPGDQISRVSKGTSGPDVIMRVVHASDIAGCIILDSKDHATWQNKFTAKLRADQHTLGADFAILSSNVFPAGTRELHIQDGVIVAHPERVPVLVHLLRRLIVENFRLKRTSKARNTKADMLFNYIVSPECRDLMEKAGKLSMAMAGLDAKEEKSHRTTWKARSALIVGVQAAYGNLSDAINGITEGRG
jgi:hypothetical protein